MPGRLRVFISSTMEDLYSERDMVAARLDQSNFEPVNAEAMLPNGATSWDHVSEEIETCHAFLLLSGTRYGWIPTSGPLAAEKISVTHGEYRAAQRLNLPVLPFFKVLKYDAESDTDEAKKRDAFRKEVGDWDNGRFRVEFTTARDLADKAAAAITRMLTDTFLRQLVAERRETAREVVPTTILPAALAALPPSLTNAVLDGRATLWAGSGISLRAGLPSASAIATALARSVQEYVRDYAMPSVGSGVASVASDFRIVFERPKLLDKLRELLDLPGGTKPTTEHAASVALFPRIITTNYDRLFEAAAAEAKSGHELLVGPTLPMELPEKFIWKIHGGQDQPDYLVITESDIRHFESFAPMLTKELQQLFSRGPLLVAGTTLRDPSILGLFWALRGEFEGYWSIPPGDSLGARRCSDMGMVPVQDPLEAVFASLRQSKEIMAGKAAKQAGD